MSRKRIFDIVVTVLASPTWVPALLVCGLAVLLFSGLPVFYRSWRRVYRSQSRRLLKFRAMVRGADRIANRETVPINGQRFLNITVDSPLYTRVGRVLERWQLTELPQLLHVLGGSMSLVGNRPLPENVISALKEEFPSAEDRFLVKCGLTGPTQLSGRETLSDEVRLRLETTYCRLCCDAYTFRLDLALLVLTVLRSFRLIKPLSPDYVEALMIRMSGARPAPADVPSFPSASSPAQRSTTIAKDYPGSMVRAPLTNVAYLQEEA